MKIWLIYFFSMANFSSTIFAQIDTTLKDYFPMQIGNVWEYEEDTYPEYWRHQVKITRDTIMPNGKKYLEYFDFGDPFYTKYYRLDDSLNVYQYNRNNCPQHEIITFKLGVKDRNFWEASKMFGINCVDTINGFIGLWGSGIRFYPKLFLSFDTKLYTEVVIKGNDTIFSPLVPKIVFIPTRLAKGVGIIWTQFEGPASNLVGAIINGKKFGNITSVGRNYENSQTPQGFEVKNYPNPFNPSTMITYQLPTNNYVSLKVFDVVGREVATLVNEVKEAGRYSVQFDGKYLSSGIYFAKLQSGGKMQMKKMLLVK